jgi:hypothetical protein
MAEESSVVFGKRESPCMASCYSREAVDLNIVHYDSI